jgi:hypothetical protein
MQERVKAWIEDLVFKQPRFLMEVGHLADLIYALIMGVIAALTTGSYVAAIPSLLAIAYIGCLLSIVLSEMFGGATPATADMAQLRQPPHLPRCADRASRSWGSRARRRGRSSQRNKRRRNTSFRKGSSPQKYTIVVIYR